MTHNHIYYKINLYLNSLTTELLSSGGSQLLSDPSELHLENIKGVSNVTTLPVNKDKNMLQHCKICHMNVKRMHSVKLQ